MKISAFGIGCAGCFAPAWLVQNWCAEQQPHDFADIAKGKDHIGECYDAICW